MSNEEKDFEDLQNKDEPVKEDNEKTPKTSDQLTSKSSEIKDKQQNAATNEDQKPPEEVDSITDLKNENAPESKTEARKESTNEPNKDMKQESSPKSYNETKQEDITDPNKEPTTESNKISKKETTTESSKDPKPSEEKPAAKKEKPERPKRPPRKKSARAKKDEEPKEETPSPKQPQLDHFVKVIEEHLGKEVIAENYINRLSKHIPTIVATPDHYFNIAKFLKEHEELAFNYLSDIHGIDYESHMEVYVHLHSMTKNHSIALKVKVERENPTIDSLTPIWEGANWPESEAYDLLGIQFKGHPDLKRILLGEDWKGYPLRKDYEPYDVEV